MNGHTITHIEVHYDDGDYFDYDYQPDTDTWTCESIPEPQESQEIITATARVARIEIKRILGDES